MIDAKLLILAYYAAIAPQVLTPTTNARLMPSIHFVITPTRISLSPVKPRVL